MPSSFPRFLDLPCELRQRIYKEVVLSTFDFGGKHSEHLCKDRSDGLCRCLYIRGTSPFVVSSGATQALPDYVDSSPASSGETQSKPQIDELPEAPDLPGQETYSPWSLLQVCRLFYREVQPILAQVENNGLVFIFVYFTPSDLQAWMLAAGSSRIAGMTRWINYVITQCGHIDYHTEPSSVSEDDESPTENPHASFFDGFALVFDITAWKPEVYEQETDTNGFDLFCRVFDTHLGQGHMRGHDCYEEIVYDLQEDMRCNLRDWAWIEKPDMNEEVLEATLSFSGVEIPNTRRARKDWGKFLQARSIESESGCFIPAAWR